MRKPVLVVGAVAAIALVAVGTHIATAGAQEPPTSFEAEAAANTLTGGAKVLSCRSCSGGKNVGWIGYDGRLTINNVQAAGDGPATVAISYTGGGRSAELSVNGGAPVALTFGRAGARAATKTVGVTLKAGANTLTFGNPNGWAPALDKVVVTSAADPLPSVSEEPAPSASPSPSASPAPSASPLPPSPTAAPSPTTAPPSDPILVAEAEVLRLVNVERAKVASCAPLANQAQLAEAARLHSEDMAKRNYFSHTTPEGVTFDQRIVAAGYKNYRALGENIAKGQRTPAEVMTAWMNSDGHRANILNCGYKDLGVGLAYDSSNTPIWTQDFGTSG